MTEQQINKPQEAKRELAGFAPLIGFGAGAGTAGQWKFAGLSSFAASWAGSVFAAFVGFIGVSYLLFVIRGFRSWGIILAGYILDTALTFAFILPISEPGLDPLSFWPYFLSSLATLLAGTVVGFAAFQAPYKHASGIVSIDFLIAGIISIFNPQALSWQLLSRVIAAYFAVNLGAAIGHYAKSAIQKDSTAVGKAVAKILSACFASIVGAVITAIVLDHMKL